MEFDKSRCYSALNADELKPGDKVIVADSIADLKEFVKDEGDVVELEDVYDENFKLRFKANHTVFLLAYLVERKENCTNCGEGKWDAEHKKILCDPVNCGNGNVVFRNQEIEVCEYYKPITKQKAEKHTNYNYYDEAKKAYDHAMTNACPEKHYRPFKDTDELIKVWEQKWSEKTNGQKWHDCKLNMPLIWVRNKNNPAGIFLVTGFDVIDKFYDGKGKPVVVVDNEYLSMQELFDSFEFLDGSPCGVEE